MSERLRWRMAEGEPGTVLYRSEHPGPVLMADGRPASSLMRAGDVSYLTLGAQLDPPAEALEHLRAQVVRRTGGPVRLVPEDPVLAEAALEAHDGEAGWTCLQRVRTSGYPPQTAAFSVELTGALVAAAESALRGEQGHLAVRFSGSDDRGGRIDRRADVGAWFRRDAEHPNPETAASQ